MYFHGKDISEQLYMSYMLHMYTYLYMTIHIGCRYTHTHMHALHKLTEITGYTSIKYRVTSNFHTKTTLI